MQLNAVFPEPLKVHRVLTSERLLAKGKLFVYHIKTSHSSFGSEFAMKVFPRKDGRPSHLYRRERRFLAMLNHPHIIRYIPVVKHDLNHDFILTEYSRNGDFSKLVIKGGISNEKIIRSYFHQLIEGVEYLHNSGVAHLDLKLENILLDKNFCLKILDFDCAESLNAKDVCIGGGTTGYRAPEVIKKQFKDLKKRDLYACGIILYALKTGELPFKEVASEKEKTVSKYEKFRDQNESFWQDKARELGIMFSQEFKELLNGLWSESTEERWSVENVKTCSWYNQEIYSCEELKREILTNGF